MARIDDDTLITTALLQRFILEAREEAGAGEHCAFVQRSNGDLTTHHPASPPCAAAQAMFAADVLRKLNKELHHPTPPAPGSMILAQPGHIMYRRFVLLWLDEDGDVQIPVEWIENESEMLDFADVLLATSEWIMTNCETAWELWRHHMVTVPERKPGETFKRAKGERAPSTRH
jgi:hypothetical protein